MTENTQSNSYVIIKNPSYSKRKRTTFSKIMYPVTVIPSIALVFTAAGASSDAVEGSITVGVLGGTILWLAGNWITTGIFGPRKKKTPKNEYEASEWLIKYNKRKNQNLLLVSFSNGILTTLPQNSKNIFLAYSIDDFENYTRIFPNSLHTHIVFKSALPHLNYNEILKIMSLYPNKCCIEEVQNELLKKCTTIKECIDVATKYPRLFDLADKKATTFVTNMPDVISYKNYFEKSINTEKMISNVIPYLSRRDLYNLIVFYPNIATIDQAKIKLIKESRSFDETLNAINRFSNYKNNGEETLLKFTKTLDQKRIFAGTFPDNKESITFNKQANKQITEKLFVNCRDYIYFIEDGNYTTWDDDNIEDIKKGQRLSYIVQNGEKLNFKLLNGKVFKLTSLST